MERFRIPMIIVAAVFFLTSFTALAEQTKPELQTKLRDLRQAKASMSNDYAESLRKINKEADDKIAGLKRDYRVARDACLEAKHNKSEELRKDFEGRLKPMLKNENSLVEQVGRDAREDFVKIRKNPTSK